MNGLNKAYIMGTVGHEPEIRSTPVGLAILKLSVATPNSRKVGDEWVDTPDWHRLTFHGRDAEYVSTTAHKGSSIAVECTIRPNKWTDRNNVMHYEVALVVERVLWLHLPSGLRAPVTTTEPPVTTLLKGEPRSGGILPVGEAPGAEERGADPFGGKSAVKEKR